MSSQSCELGVQIVEVAEGAGEEEVLADVAERSLDFALRLRPIRTAGSGQEAIVLGERDQRAIVDDVTIAILAGHRGLHAVVEDLDRHAADRREGQHVTAQQRLQILMHDEASEDMPGMAEHQREQPDDPGDAGLIGEADDEAGEVDLGLMPGARLEADLERLRPLARSDRRDKALHGRVGAGIAPLTELARQPRGGQFREGGHPLAQVIEIGRKLVRPSNLAWLYRSAAQALVRYICEPSSGRGPYAAQSR